MRQFILQSWVGWQRIQTTTLFPGSECKCASIRENPPDKIFSSPFWSFCQEKVAHSFWLYPIVLVTKKTEHRSIASLGGWLTQGATRSAEKSWGLVRAALEEKNFMLLYIQFLAFFRHIFWLWIFLFGCVYIFCNSCDTSVPTQTWGHISPSDLVTLYCAIYAKNVIYVNCGVVYDKFTLYLCF